MARRIGTLLTALLVAILAACGGGSDVAGLPTVQEVLVSGEAQLPLDATTRLQATLRGADGEAVAGRPVFWSTGDETIATVDQTGLVTPLAIGRVQIAASADGRSGVFDLQVVRKRVRTIDVVVSAAEVAVGDTIAAQASARAGDGGDVSGVAPSFSSTAPEIASVTADGRIVGRAPGTAGIVASADGVSDTTVVSVVPARVVSLVVEPATFELTVGQTLPLRVTVRDRTGAPLAGRAVSYASSAAGVATIGSEGTVRAVAAGAATITATSEGVSATSRVTVVAPPANPPPPPPRAPVPATLTISPNVVSLHVGATRALSTTLRDTDGEVITGRRVTWTSNAPATATVSASGVVTAVAPGATVIVATSEGISASAGVTVSNVPVASVAVTPGEASLQVGATQQLTATPRNASGAALPGRAVTWASSAASVAAVSSTGEVRAVGAGSATITATSEGRQGTARITVTAVPAPPPPPPRPATLTISPPAATLQVGETAALAATLRDTDGNVLSGRPVTWTSNAPAIATVGADGLVTAVAPGAAVIVATSEGISATAGVTVANVPVATVDVTPPDASLEVGATLQLDATPRAASGAALPGRVVTWASSAPAIATVSSTGEVRAIAAGDATITATSEGRDGAARIAVTAPPPPPPPPPPPDPDPAGPPTRIEKVSGDNQRGDAGEELRSPVVMRILDADGRPVPGVNVLWLTGHGGRFEPEVSTSDAFGLVATRWRLGNRDGRQWAQAVVIGLPPVTFGAVAQDD